jgi:hypothetical protein
MNDFQFLYSNNIISTGKSLRQAEYLAFTGTSHRLGGRRDHTVSDQSVRQRAIESALQRSQRPPGGRNRLGSSSSSSLSKDILSLVSPREMAVMAAMKRSNDTLWCGSEMTVVATSLQVSDATQPETNALENKLSSPSIIDLTNDNDCQPALTIDLTDE